MSKCREEFEKLYKGQELVRSLANPECYADLEVTRAWRYHKNAWNARGRVDAEICHQSKELELAEAIEKEDAK